MDWHLAQINIGRLVAPVDDPRIAGFISKLDAINALAEQTPGFVWRLQSGSGNATDIVYNDDPFYILNMSVWESVEELRDYVYSPSTSRLCAIALSGSKSSHCRTIVCGGFPPDTAPLSPKAANDWSTIRSTARLLIHSGSRDASPLPT
jgi:hypothetical protein